MLYLLVFILKHVCGGGFVYILAHKRTEHARKYPDLIEGTEHKPVILNALTVRLKVVF